MARLSPRRGRPTAPRPAAVGITLAVRNRQRTRAVRVPLVRRLTRWLLAHCFHAAGSRICVHIVGTTEIARLNWEFLRHEGSTDVITFDHSQLEDCPERGGIGPSAPDANRTAAAPLHGEIFVSIDEAVAQSRIFHTTWESELTRYIIHGLLHLRGYDDLKARERRRMKREEDRLVDMARKQFALRQMAVLTRQKIKRATHG